MLLLCTYTREDELHNTITLLHIIVSVLMLVSALGAFAGMSYQDYKTSINSQVSRFHWGFYVDIPGVVLVLLSALLYLIESCRYDGYERGRNEVV